jgi:hypothetical protein
MLPFKREEIEREGGGDRERENKQAYLLCFLKKEEERGRENKQTYLLCFLKKKREGEKEKNKEERGTSRPLKTDPSYLALVIYKILKKTFVL